jgi:hypothetical protein
MVYVTLRNVALGGLAGSLFVVFSHFMSEQGSKAIEASLGSKRHGHLGWTTRKAKRSSDARISTAHRFQFFPAKSRHQRARITALIDRSFFTLSIVTVLTN